MRIALKKWMLRGNMLGFCTILLSVLLLGLYHFTPEARHRAEMAAGANAAHRSQRKTAPAQHVNAKLHLPLSDKRHRHNAVDPRLQGVAPVPAKPPLREEHDDKTLRVLSRRGPSEHWVDTGHRVQTDCKDRSEPLHFRGQGKEDYALYARYFSKPVICNGTFVEIGALNGKLISNTLTFEESLHWTGALIEGHPLNYVQLRKNRPNVKTFGEAVCKRGQNTLEFVSAGSGREAGGVLDEMSQGHVKHWVKKNAKKFTVPCRPIGDILRAAGLKAVDFFVLDVEGAELMVIETMDWKIPIKVFVVEMGRGAEKDAKLRKIMFDHGYRQPEWKIGDYCRKPGRKGCPNNEVFENMNYKYEK